jgi:predicted ATPase/DNA-binding SARP family transcriptional activator/Tfp pilus assembly protein PilF
MSTLTIQTLGDCQITLNGQRISAFETDKSRALLVYLAIESAKPQRRSHLAGLLWSEEREERALHNLRQTLSSLRKTLGDTQAETQFLIVDRESIQLNPQADIWIDAKVFSQHLSSAYQYYQLQLGQGVIHVRWLKKALEIFRGQFLDHYSLQKSPLFDEWVILVREDYNLWAIRALTFLAEYHEKRAEYHLAVEDALRIVDLSPWDETARGKVLRLLGVTQQWSAAEQQYAALQKYLIEQLDVTPSEDIVSLYHEIRAAAAGNHPLLPAHPRTKYHIPLPLSPFIGRESELDELMTLVVSPEHRLVSVVGPGGIGKSRLAIELAHQFAGIFSDGVWFVSCVNAQSTTQIIRDIAEAAGLVFTEQPDLKGQLITHLRDREIFLVLDNYEHLLTDSSSLTLLDDLLLASPSLVILTTTRERLHLQQETVYDLSGLRFPSTIEEPLERCLTYDALALFARRASQLQKGFVLTEACLPSVIRICRVLEGLPLGVELAAALIVDQGYNGIADRIEVDLDLLATHMHNIPPRHRSLRAAFEVSWEALSSDLQLLLSQLSVFQDGFDRPAAQTITGASPVMLSNLLSKSLIRLSAHDRLNFHEVIRHFVSEKLNHNGLMHEVRARHANYFCSLLADKNTALKGVGQTTAIEMIQRDLRNIQLAWAWLVENKNQHGLKRCMDSLYHFFIIRSYHREGIEWFQQAIQGLEDNPDAELTQGMLLSRLGSLAYAAREKTLVLDALSKSQDIFVRWNAVDELAICHLFLGWMYHREKNFIEAQQYADQSLGFFKSKQNELGCTEALILAGSIQNRQGHNHQAQVFFEEALTLSRRQGNQRLQTTILNRLGDLICYQGEYDAGIELFHECLAISQELNDRYHQAILLNNIGTIHHIREEYVQAERYYLDSLTLCQAIGDQDGEALALSNLGELALAQKDYTAALGYAHDALQIAEHLQEYWTIIVCHNCLGEIFCAMGKLEESKAHFHQAIQLAMKINSKDLAARVSVNAARTYQLLNHQPIAITLLQAALAHSSTELDARDKAKRWLQEMQTSDVVEPDDFLLEKILEKLFPVETQT